MNENNKDYTPILDRAAKFSKDTSSIGQLRGGFVGRAESSEVVAKREKEKQEAYDIAKKDIDNLKFPNTEKAKKIVEKLEKNVSKIKVNGKQEMEIIYYTTLQSVIAETKARIEKIDNFKNDIVDYDSLNRIGSGWAKLDYKLDNVIDTISELENLPI